MSSQERPHVSKAPRTTGTSIGSEGSTFRSTDARTNFRDCIVNHRRIQVHCEHRRGDNSRASRVRGNINNKPVRHGEAAARIDLRGILRQLYQFPRQHRLEPMASLEGKTGDGGRALVATYGSTC